MHIDHVSRVRINPKRYQFVIKVIYGVKVLQEQSSKQKVAIVELIKRVLSYSELANVVFALVEVGLWAHFKEGVFYVETDIVEFGSDVIAWHEGLTEGRVGLAIEVGNSLLPLVLKCLIVIRWHSNEGRACVDDRRVRFGLTLVLKRLAIIQEVLGVQGPASKV